MQNASEQSGQERWREWFTQPPYLGAWVAALLLALLVAAGVAALRRPPAETVVVVPPAPSPSVEAPLAQAPAGIPAVPEETPEEPEPEVSVRTLPGKEPRKDEKTPPVSVEITTPRPPAPEPAVRPAEPEPLPSGEMPTEDTPRVETPAPPVTPRETAPPPVPSPPARTARERTGTLFLYFDADSSTFDRGGDRLPLEVEVYVDGEKRLETGDPEKREFAIRRLAPGTHEVRIVPRVGNAPPDPRWVTIEIDPSGENRYRAVLRKSDGMSRISKFRRRD